MNNQDTGATFEKGRGLKCAVYSDSEYAHDESDPCSASGGVIMCGGATVSWRSSTQRCVTLSSSEAKYVARVDIIKEALLVQEVLVFLASGFEKSLIVVFKVNTGGHPSRRQSISLAQLAHVTHMCSAISCVRRSPRARFLFHKSRAKDNTLMC